MMIALLGTAAAILLPVCYYFLLFIFKRKTTRSSSSEDNKGDGNDETSSTDASIVDLPDGETYEVFLSFRGEDTRKGFSDHLYQRLVNAGVWVFRDNEALRVGEEIGPELDKAIKDSKISIPIISPNYASSKWCLRELVCILECKKVSGQIVLPIFYNVKPSGVRNQTGTFKEAFRLHEKKHGSNSKVVQEWRNALAEVGSLKGWESAKIADGHEGQLVEIVVTKVLNELKKKLDVTEYLVGAEDHKEKILKMVEGEGSSDVQAIVIHGIGGVGKTTLVKFVYNQLYSKFDCCCFLPDIRENLSEKKVRPEDLRKQLISNIIGMQGICEISRDVKARLKQRKVLILFDDVDNSNQLDVLARERSWFKTGSLLIVTTRNKDVAKAWEEMLTYELNGLDSSLSLLLFCRHAFRRDECPSKEFDDIAKDIVSTTGGLPLAIEIIGSMLLRKPIKYWKDSLKKLQKIPNEDVQKKLRISYDALDNEQKQIFLDIACLPIRDKIRIACYMWDDCEFFPGEGLEKLESLSLIKRGEENQLIIHDQLLDLGRAIVREEGYSELGNRSRLWDEKEALELMQRKQGTAKIQALNLRNESRFCFYTSEQFKDLTNLRFLRLYNARLMGDFENLLLDLRWFQWNGCSSDSLPTNFRPTKLVVLDLSRCFFHVDWASWAQFKWLRKLKVLILDHCYCFTETPDFTPFKSLEILSVKGCKNLSRIHPSICNLNKTLLTLDARNCERLEELPNEMGKMEELTQFLVDGTSIKSIPISKGFMTKLEIISANGCVQLRRLPNSIGSLANLVTLSLDSCHELEMLPETVGNLKSLTELKLGWSKVTELPNSIGDLHNLKVLDISKTSIKRLPTTFGKLRNLQHFIANYLDELTEVPDEIGQLSSLRFLSFRECSFLSRLPESFRNLSGLQTLDLSGCKELKLMPNLPGSLTSLNFSGESMETFPNITSLSNLKDPTMFERHSRALNFASLNNLESLSIDGISYPINGLANAKLILELPSSLKKLHLSNCPALQALPCLSNFNLLSSLEIVRCGNLSKLSWMDDSVTYRGVQHCNALESLPHLLGVRNLKSLIVRDCTNLIEIQGLNSVECLEKLEIGLCPSLERLGNLSRLKMLRELILVNCEKLSDFDGIDEQESLKTLIVVGCNPNIKSINLAKLKNLEFLEINHFEVLIEIMLLEKLEYLQGLRIFGCNSLDKLPDISLFTSLEEMHIDGCEKLKEINALQGLKFLRKLYVSNCNSLKNLPDFSLFTNLQCLLVKGCGKLTEIKGLPMSLKVLDISRCELLANLPDLWWCHNLEGLLAHGCNKLTKIIGLQSLMKLEILDFSNCKSLENLPDLSVFRSLRHLDLNGCDKLTRIKGSPTSIFFRTLDISRCKSLANLPDFKKHSSFSSSFKGLLAGGCSKLTNVMGLPQLSKLEVLDLSGCKSLKELPELSKLQNLKYMYLSGCKKLTEIKGLPISLNTLDISGCKLLENVPDFSEFHSLKVLLAEDCSRLKEFRGLENLQGIRVLCIHGCESLRRKPDISKNCIHTDPLPKNGGNISPTGNMTSIIHGEMEQDHDGLPIPKYHVSITGSRSTFQFDGNDPQEILSYTISFMQDIKSAMMLPDCLSSPSEQPTVNRCNQGISF